VDRRWHLVALCVFALAAVIHTRGWFATDRMPLGDFPGYAAQVQYVRDAMLEHGRVPLWCVECYGGTTNLTGHLKEYLAFPLAVAFEPVLATKLAFVLLRVIAALGLYGLVARWLAAPAAGIAAGYAYSYGAIANHQIEHLDVVVAAALLPLSWLSAALVLRRGGARWAIALGVAVACQFVNNWVHAATAPLAVLGLALFRPWRAGPDEDAPWLDAALARRWALRAIAAVGVFLAFAASQLAWLASDARNHRLYSAEVSAVHRAFYVERSPFLFINRDDVLGPWLAQHQPPGFGTEPLGAEQRYVGGVVLAVVFAGAFALRRDEGLRRWAALAALAFGVQYWLALGPRTLLWEVAESLHWSPASQAGLAVALRAASALCLLLCVAMASRHRVWRAGALAGRARVGLWLGAALLLFFPTASLWSVGARWIPALEVQRSPGHFFDTAPFALYLLFAVCLAAISRRVARPRVAHALAAAVAIGLVLDFAPSTRSFSIGVPMRQLRESAALVQELQGEDGTLRVGLARDYSPLQSWLVAQSPAGHAWGWLRWQAGKYWADSFVTAAYGGALAEPSAGAWSERYAPMLATARVRYLLLAANAVGPRPPWRRLRADARFAVWEQPEVSPMAAGYRAYLWLDGAPPRGVAARVADALRENALVVAEPERGEVKSDLRSGASRVALQATDSDLPLLASPAPAPLAATYRRPQPERVVVELDAGSEPAMVFVSEGYHPWWRATVDGERAPVLRAALAHIAVPVGPGRHTVLLHLERPALVAAADRLTAAAWLGLLLGAPAALLARRVRSGS